MYIRAAISTHLRSTFLFWGFTFTTLAIGERVSEGVISMLKKSRAWLLVTPVLAMLFEVTGVRVAVASFHNTTPGLVDKTWELQDLKNVECLPPLGVEVSDLGMGIVKRTTFFSNQGMLKQQDTISPGGDTKNLLQATFEITGDNVNIRWKPEDQQVDTYKIAGLTDTSVTLAKDNSTCRYTHAAEAPMPTPTP
jgi:hypothetical protein